MSDDVSNSDDWPFDPAPLGARLDADGMELDLSAPAKRFGGGLANHNYLVVIDRKPVVLRRAPSGPLPPGAHDMAREHRVLSRLWQVFEAAPRGLYLCEDPAVLGAPFQLIEYRAGRVLRGDLDGLREGEDLAGTMTGMMARLLGDLHAVDPAACGLDTLGRPEGFVIRNLERWTGRAAALTDGTPGEALVADLSAWLTGALGSWEDRDTVLLHSDFKLDNIILAEDRLQPVALVDWDMATRGDALFDLATLLSYWVEPGDPECLIDINQMPTHRSGFPTRRDMAEAYRRASGRSLDGLEELTILCLLKLGTVFLQLHARWKDGALGDARYAAFGRQGLELIEHAYNVARSRAG